MWDLFESAEAAEAVIERTIQLEQVNERFMIWAKRVTEELEADYNQFDPVVDEATSRAPRVATKPGNRETIEAPVMSGGL